MHGFTPLPALAGGALIGLSASLLLVTHGRVAGISGILGGALAPRTEDRGWRLWFLAGLGLAAALLALVAPSTLPRAWSAPLGTLAVAGVLVGFGTRLGNGCTSGHGVCGVARLSPRSLAATGVFMAAGAATVYLPRHVLGGAS